MKLQLVSRVGPDVVFVMTDGAHKTQVLPQGWGVHPLFSGGKTRWRIAPRAQDKFGIVISMGADTNRVDVALRYLAGFDRISHYRPKDDGGLLVILKALARAVDYQLGLAHLLLSVWKASPSKFGLRGHESEHPCSRRFCNALYSQRGPLRKGLVEISGPGSFRLTAAGLNHLSKVRLCPA